MNCKIKYPAASKEKNLIIDQIIDNVQIPCKPNIGDNLFVDGLLLLVNKVTVVCRLSNDKNMKRYNLLISCTIE